MTVTLPPAVDGTGHSNVRDRTLEQRLAALESANRIRTRRARMKQELHAGLNPVPLITDPPAWLAGMRASAFLLALPKVGPRKAKMILLGCHIDPARTLGGLTSRQRDALAEVVAVRAPTGRQPAPDPFTYTCPVPDAGGPVSASETG